MIHHNQFMNQGSGGAPSGGDLSGVSGIVAWYDADATRVTKDGSNNVSSVADRSSTNEPVVQSNSDYKPTWLATGAPNSQPCFQFRQYIAFTKEPAYLQCATLQTEHDLLDRISMILIFEWDEAMDNTSDEYISFGNPETSAQNEGYGHYLSTTIESRFYVGDDAVDTASYNIGLNTWYYMKATWDKDLASGAITQTLEGFGSGTNNRTISMPTSDEPLGLGGVAGNYLKSFPGKVAEAILIDHKISAAEETEIDTYIDNKFGL
jgi:hypothetical protein